MCTKFTLFTAYFPPNQLFSDLEWILKLMMLNKLEKYLFWLFINTNHSKIFCFYNKTKYSFFPNFFDFGPLCATAVALRVVAVVVKLTGPVRYQLTICIVDAGGHGDDQLPWSRGEWLVQTLRDSGQDQR